MLVVCGEGNHRGNVKMCLNMESGRIGEYNREYWSKCPNINEDGRFLPVMGFFNGFVDLSRVGLMFHSRDNSTLGVWYRGMYYPSYYLDDEGGHFLDWFDIFYLDNKGRLNGYRGITGQGFHISGRNGVSMSKESYMRRVCFGELQEDVLW